jgi:hypothetical protein
MDAMSLFRPIVASLVLVLAACASAPPKRINPPQVTIHRLASLGDGGYDIELRLQNHSDVPMRFASLDLQLRVAGIDAGRLAASPDLEVSPHNAEIVGIRMSAQKDMAEPLAAAEGANEPERVVDGEFEYENANGDWVKVPIDATRRAEIDRALAAASSTSVHYMLRGKVQISEPKRDYDILSDSRLSPVPGKPGEFR